MDGKIGIPIFKNTTQLYLTILYLIRNNKLANALDDHNVTRNVTCDIASKYIERCLLVNDDDEWYKLWVHPYRELRTLSISQEIFSEFYEKELPIPISEKRIIELFKHVPVKYRTVGRFKKYTAIFIKSFHLTKENDTI